ncbi:MAG: DUF502 domain-containing protein [candidate division Zixibacteria bacterium]|jgi:uncharacterized membrane protein|nr:DUF502 domain-containing protein [candidate division Zixibacteria bacterium]
MNITGQLKKIFRNSFLSGLLVIVPLILTFVLLKGMVQWVDDIVEPLVVKLFGHAYFFPFVGIIITFVLIMITGFLAANVLGKKILRLWEFLLLHIPLVNFIYGSAKQFVQALTLPQKKIFKSVVLVEYPRPGIYALGFLANQTKLEGDGQSRELLCVFIASTPTPFTGIAIFFPPEQVVFLNMPVEEGIKLAVSGGIITPEKMYRYINRETNFRNEITARPVADNES